MKPLLPLFTRNENIALPNVSKRYYNAAVDLDLGGEAYRTTTFANEDELLNNDGPDFSGSVNRIFSSCKNGR